MVVVLGLFYFGQDERLQNEEAIKSAVRNACEWILSSGYENVVIEINNECSVPKYEHELLRPHRVHLQIPTSRHRVSRTEQGLRVSPLPFTASAAK